MNADMGALALDRAIAVPTVPAATAASANAVPTFGLSCFSFFEVLLMLSFILFCLSLFVFFWLFGDASRYSPAHRGWKSDERHWRTCRAIRSRLSS